ncbi:MAG: molybdopterin-guanine dinucleotide biosynthesis protein B [Kordiimonas sp.]|nr:molybdopterin-guanine dinucleotide biosynthesis protein B [Kordiimonas sp.]
MKVIGIAGWSGSGKTTLMEQVIPLLQARGHSVSVVKHCHHHFDIDQPGKDSHRHRTAGAGEVMLVSDQRWALMHEAAPAEKIGLDEICAKMSPVDILLVEGFKGWDIPKIEVHRPAVGKELLAPHDPSVCAIATDDMTLAATVPLLDVNDPKAVVRYIEMLIS